MSAWLAIQKLQSLLAEIPVDVLPAGHCTTTRPAATSELPAIAVSADDVAETSAGLGGHVGTRRLPGPAWASSTATRSTGTLGVELWAVGATAMGALAEATFSALRATPTALAEAGFERLTVRSVGPGEQLALGDADALRMAIGCAFSHEAVPPAAAETEGLIRTVHVELTDELHEVMEIP